MDTSFESARLLLSIKLLLFRTIPSREPFLLGKMAETHIRLCESIGPEMHLVPCCRDLFSTNNKEVLGGLVLKQKDLCTVSPLLCKVLEISELSVSIRLSPSRSPCLGMSINCCGFLPFSSNMQGLLYCPSECEWTMLGEKVRGMLESLVLPLSILAHLYEVLVLGLTIDPLFLSPCSMPHPSLDASEDITS